jgi:hypothetical protein
MILTDPPRVVLDLLIPGAAPEPKPAVASTPPPVVEPEVEPERTTPETIAAREPEQTAPEVIAVAEPEPEPEPQPVVTTPEPEAAPEPVAVIPDVAQAEAPAVDPSAAEAAAADAAVAPLETAADDLAAAAEVAVEPVEVTDTDGTAADAELVTEVDAEVADAAEAAAPLAVIDAEDLLAGNRTAAESDAVEPDAAPVVPEVPAAREAARTPTQARTDATSGGLPFGLDLPLAGMIAAAVAVLLVLVILVVRSRATKPDEMDVTALAGEAEAADDTDEASHEGRIPEGGFAMGTAIDQNSHPAEDFEFGSAEPVAQDDENKPIESADVVLGSTPGLFNESPQEKDAMNMDNQDLPVTHTDSEAPTQLGIGAAAIGSDMDSSVANLMQEMERRMAHMEARLDESNEARERLERQVEAQAEELRVQRAAIARTQRALRSLNRSEEDQATEPALRDPSTPTG